MVEGVCSEPAACRSAERRLTLFWYIDKCISQLFLHAMRSSKRFKRLAVLLLVIFVAWLGSSALMTWKLTHRSHGAYAEPLSDVTLTPNEEHRLTTWDDQQIGAWLVRGSPRRGCVLVLHGNGGSRSSMQNVMRILVANELTVMAISLRAHGDSTGEINDFGFSARHDVAAAVRFLEAEFPGRPIYIVGRSLGAAAALFAAEELTDRVAGYWLEQPYTDLTSATWNRLQIHLPPILDWVAYGGMRCCAAAMFPIDVAEVAPAKCITTIPKSIPITILTGSADRHARLNEVREIFARVADHARLVVFEGAEHTELDVYNPDLYRKTLLEAVTGGDIAD
jgi:uncharacterized protein